MATQPVFLVGAERSGSTMLRLMLDSHPKIAFVEEFEYSVDQIVGSELPSLDNYYDYLATHRIFGTSGFEIDESLDFVSLVNSWLDTRQEVKKSEVVGATVHYDFEKLLDIWPDARFIHIVRDPRDVALSVLAREWVHNAYDAANFWLEAEQTWDMLLSRIDSERFIEVRYSELVQDPSWQLDRICKFLELEFTPEMFSYVEETDYEYPSRSVSSNWQHDVDARSVALIEARVGTMLSKRGFELSGIASIEVGEKELSAIRNRHRFDGIRSRTRKYGFFIAYGELITRKLGSKFLHDKFALAVNKKKNERLKKSWRDSAQPHGSAR